jgi:hypothetical protein
MDGRRWKLAAKVYTPNRNCAIVVQTRNTPRSEDQMRIRLTLVVALLAATLFASAEIPADLSHSAAETDPAGLVVHEWGTFTSVAGPDGAAVEWLPLNVPRDLPCFVDKVRYHSKGWIVGTVRMETPVLYFYSPQDATVDVRVRFPQGVITEWFPKALVSHENVFPGTLSTPGLEGAIAWNQVQVRPRGSENFPTERGDSHYFVARQTDAAPLQVGAQQEKFLFYRGVGSFAPPVRASLRPDGSVSVRSADGQAVGLVDDVMLFQNRNGRMTFTSHRSGGRPVTLRLPPRTGTSSSPREEIVRRLVSNGLYHREATAMVDTWRDSWFEEGTRVFYILPTRAVDPLLPLEITPAPASVARVFVGRIELVTPAIIDAVRNAALERDGETLAKYARFLRPILARVQDSYPSVDQGALSDALNLAWKQAPEPACR